VRRGEVHWADLPEGFGRRPVVILSRDAVIPVRTRITIAPITRTVHEIRSEVSVGGLEGLTRDSVVNTDEILTVLKRRLDPETIGSLGPVKLRELESAIHYALDLRD
jgi:mRNA interferase MazF